MSRRRPATSSLQPHDTSLRRHADTAEPEDQQQGTPVDRRSVALRAPIRVQRRSAQLSPAPSTLPSRNSTNNTTATPSSSAETPSTPLRTSHLDPHLQSPLPPRTQERQASDGVARFNNAPAAIAATPGSHRPPSQSQYSIVAAQRKLTYQIKQQQQPSRLLACLQAHTSAPLNAIHVSAAFSHAAQLSAAATAAVEYAAFLKRTVPRESTATPQPATLSRPLSPSAAGPSKPSQLPGTQSLLRFLFAQVPAVLLEFGPRQLSNTLWACGKLDSPPPPHLLHAMLDRCALLAHKFGPTDCANLLWGLGTMGHPYDNDWLQHFLDSSQHCLPAAKPQELVNMLYGLAKSEAQPPEAWIQAALEAVAVASLALDPQGLSNILWALARLQYKPPDAWLQQFVTVLARKADLLNPQALANSLWALSVFGFFPEAQLPSSAGRNDVPGRSASGSSSSSDSRTTKRHSSNSDAGHSATHTADSTDSDTRSEATPSVSSNGHGSNTRPGAAATSRSALDAVLSSMPAHGQTMDSARVQAHSSQSVTHSWDTLLHQVYRQLDRFTAAGLLSVLHTITMMVPRRVEAGGDRVGAERAGSHSGDWFAHSQSSLVLAIASQFTATDRTACLASAATQRRPGLASGHAGAGITEASQASECLMGGLAPWELSNLLWSLAKLRLVGPGSGSGDLTSAGIRPATAATPQSPGLAPPLARPVATHPAGPEHGHGHGHGGETCAQEGQRPPPPVQPAPPGADAWAVVKVAPPAAVHAAPPAVATLGRDRARLFGTSAREVSTPSEGTSGRQHPPRTVSSSQPATPSLPSRQQTAVGLYLRGSGWVGLYSQALQQQLPGFGCRDMEQLLWAVHQLQLQLPWPTLRSICSAAATMVSELSDAELADATGQAPSQPPDVGLVRWLDVVAQRLQGPLDSELEAMQASADRGALAGAALGSLEAAAGPDAYSSSASSASSASGASSASSVQSSSHFPALTLIRMTSLVGQLERSTLASSAEWVGMYLQVLQLRLLQQAGPVSDGQAERRAAALATPAPRLLTGQRLQGGPETTWLPARHEHEEERGGCLACGSPLQCHSEGRERRRQGGPSVFWASSARCSKGVWAGRRSLDGSSNSSSSEAARQCRICPRQQQDGEQQGGLLTASRHGSSTGGHLPRQHFTAPQLCRLLYSLTVVNQVVLTSSWLECFAAALQEALRPSVPMFTDQDTSRLTGATAQSAAAATEMQDTMQGMGGHEWADFGAASEVARHVEGDARQRTVACTVLPRPCSYLFLLTLQHLQGRRLALAEEQTEACVLGSNSAAGAGHSLALRVMAFSPDGQYLLTAADDKAVKLWSVNGWECVAAWFLASTDKDYKIRVSILPPHPTKGAPEIQSYCLGHTAFVTSAKFVSLPAASHTSDSTQQQQQARMYLITGSGDGSVRLWEPESGKLLDTYVASLPIVETVQIPGQGGADAAEAEGVAATAEGEEAGGEGDRRAGTERVLAGERRRVVAAVAVEAVGVTMRMEGTALRKAPAVPLYWTSAARLTGRPLQRWWREALLSRC
ncbi:MAG: hypothetical protein WDW38_011520 [Sanguina aurantia]